MNAEKVFERVKQIVSQHSEDEWDSLISAEFPNITDPYILTGIEVICGGDVLAVASEPGGIRQDE